jgi:diadenosine tetraphosphate (Ap4A) HIT family hydrolase
VILTSWPLEFFDRKAGRGCAHCVEGRASETEHGVRFFEGASTDGYLQRTAPTPGYAVVIFRERHVPNLHSMTPSERTRFWTEVGTIAQAIENTYEPAHLNVQVLGNAVPHVHAPRLPTRPRPFTVLALVRRGVGGSGDNQCASGRRLVEPG